MTWETLQEMELGWVEGVVERISGEERRGGLVGFRKLKAVMNVVVCIDKLGEFHTVNFTR